MGYVNPMLAYGLERFVAEAAAAGADGLIVPDLPPDEPEAEELIALCRQHGLATVFLLAPTSTADRISLGVARSQGFVYLVSVAGITGARDRLPDDLSAFVQRVRAEAQRQSPGRAALPGRRLWHQHAGAVGPGGPDRRWRHRRQRAGQAGRAGWRRSGPDRGRLCG